MINSRQLTRNNEVISSEICVLLRCIKENYTYMCWKKNY